MLTLACRTPDDLSFLKIQLQLVRLHPVGDDADALKQLQLACVDLNHASEYCQRTNVVTNQCLQLI